MQIYKITNNVNGKLYIGKDALDRNDYYGSGKLIKRAIKKYGKNNFKKEIIDKCKTVEQLNRKEKFWIKKLNSRIPLGYNIEEGGNGGASFTGNHHTNETKIKISKALLGKKFSKERRKNISKGKLGKSIDGSSRRGLLHSDEHKKRISKSLSGRKLTKIHKQNISKAKKGKENIALQGRIISKEWRKKISISQKIRLGKLKGEIT